jgi:hypothetical protein
MPNDPDLTPDHKSARTRTARLMVGLIVLLGAVPPSINATSNPRIATLHGADVMGLIAIGLCIGSGLSLLITGLFSRAE